MPPVPTIKIKSHEIGEGHPTFIIAEMSANHAGSFDNAMKIVRAAKDAGADCLKIQTYKPDTITLESRKKYFRVTTKTWEGENLYDLYGKAFTPWEWQAKLKAEAEHQGLSFFSTAYDKTAVDFLESIGIEFYKIASFEVNDIPLLKYVASKKKPIILSTGMASLGEIQEAVNTIKGQGNNAICLLRCSSEYPALLGDLNLRTIPNMRETFGYAVGFSDHTLGSIAAITAVAQGASVIEKHFCLSRSIDSPDSSFSMEPDEFKKMVENIRDAESALGTISYDLSERERNNRAYRKSIFASKDIKAGEIISEQNVKVVRPAHGLEPKFYEALIGRKARVAIEKGTPIAWNLIE